MDTDQWYQAIALTVFAVVAMGWLGFLVFRIGFRAGRASLRKQLGIAGQRRLKKQEMLVHSAHDILERDLRFNRHPPENSTDIFLWLKRYEEL